MPDEEYQPPPPYSQPPPPQAPPPGQYPPQAWPPPPGAYHAQPGGYYPQVPPVNATLILIFGILGIVLAFGCIVGGVFGVVAWIMGNSALQTLDATGDPLSQRGTVQAGRICGMVALAVMVLYSFIFIAALAFGFFSTTAHPHGGILIP